MISTILGNSTHIDFTECKKILRNIYEIDSESILTFVQLELNNKDNNTLVNKVEYMIFDNNKIKLDLGLCRDTNIKIVYSIKDFILTDTEIYELKYWQESGINLLNINDSFYNDICFTYTSENGTDCTLKDRVNIFYKYLHFSL